MSFLFKLVTTYAQKRVARSFTPKLVNYFKQDLFERIEAGAGTAEPGHRCWPNATKDKAYGIRFDWGEKFMEDNLWFRNLVLQLNKDAEYAAIKTEAKLHEKRMLFRVRLNHDGSALHPELTQETLLKDVFEAIEGGV